MKLRRKRELNQSKANRLENKIKRRRAKPLVAAENGQAYLVYLATQSPKGKPQKACLVEKALDPSKFDGKGERAKGLVIIKLL
jgi:hypothetical protein